MAETEVLYKARKGGAGTYISESQVDSYIEKGFAVTKITREVLSGGTVSGSNKATARASTKSNVVAAESSDEDSTESEE